MIFQEDQENLINYSTPQVVVIEREPEPIISPVNFNVLGLVFQSTYGEPNKIQRVSNIDEFSKAFGGYLNGLDGYDFADDFFKQNGGSIDGVRVTDGTEAKATVNLLDAPSGSIVSTFDALYGGTGGNEITVVVEDATVTGYVDMRFIRGNQTIEILKTTTDINDERYIGTLLNNEPLKLVTYTAVLTDGTLPQTGTFNLTGGDNGTNFGGALPDTAYIGTDTLGIRTGLQVFKESDEVIQVGSARNTNAINNALITHVSDLSLSPRETIVTFASGTTVASAITEMANYDTDRAQFIFNYLVARNRVTGENEFRNPTALAFAEDSKNTYNISKSQKSVHAEIIGTEFNLTGTEVDQLTKARINPLTRKRGSGIIFRSNYSASSNPAKNQFATRRAKDVLAINIALGTQQFLSRNIDEDLYVDIQSAINGYLALEKRAGRINGFNIKIDADNNPVEIRRLNRVVVEINISLKAFADNIKIYINASIENALVQTN